VRSILLFLFFTIQNFSKLRKIFEKDIGKFQSSPKMKRVRVQPPPIPKFRSYCRLRLRHRLKFRVSYVEFCSVLIDVEVFHLCLCPLMTLGEKSERQVTILVLFSNLSITTCRRQLKKFTNMQI
jgi:hypothetical protein